ncbi:MAG TPA: PAS domain S-box protein [Ktedonobacteraceae bacterium]|nr:PAS domain S-box protein [Ktedonobacteraceae bacterium]
MHSHQPLQEDLGIYEAIVASSDDAIISKTLQGIITSWNPAAVSLFGYTAQEAIGQSILLIIPEERHSEEVEILAKLRQGKRIEHYETVRQRKDGTRIEVSLGISPVKDRNGTIVGATKIARDISERRQAERARLHLAALVESADTPIIGKTSEGIITSWNRAAQHLYGYSAQEAVGQSITLIFPADSQEEFLTIMERIRRGERVELYETIRQRKDGTLVPVSVVVSPIYDHTGLLIGASDIAHDITERKRVEAEEQMLAQLSQILASTLHYQETLTAVTHLAIPRLADWCTVDLLDAAGHRELAELAHIDPEQVRWARTLHEHFPIDPEAPRGIAQVLRSGRAELYPEITDELLVEASRNEEELALARQMGFTSALLVPLVAQGKITGGLSLVTTTSGRHYTAHDLTLAEEMGRRIGLALENARLYREVQQSRNQLDIILQGVADGIIVYAPTHRVLYANAVAAQMSGVPSLHELLEQPDDILLTTSPLIDEQGHPLSPEALPHCRVLAGAPEAQATLRIQGVERWVQIISRPVRTPSGAVTMAISIWHDITERMRVEHRKDEFISMTSHELKTPVTSLKGFTNVLQRRLSKQGDEQGLSYLARMDAQIDKLTRLIRDLLDTSRMQAGKLALRLEAFELDALLNEVVDNVQMTTTSHQLCIEGQTGVQVLGDPDRLGQVFINLLTNAIKYSPEADHVIIYCFREGKQVVVSVQDFGIGIDPRHHDRIFEHFYQVNDPEEKTYPGLGIGLYLAREIVSRHQGRIWIESRKGAGSTFFVALPQMEPKEQAEPAAPLQQQGQEESHAAH